MKKNSLVISILSCILLVTALCSCSSSSGYDAPKRLSGIYVGQDTEESYAEFDYLEFFSDGKYTSNRSNYEGNYSIDGNRIRLEGILVDSKTYYFRVKGDTLELCGNEDFEYPEVYKKD